MRTINHIESKFRDFNNNLSSEFEELYENIDNEKLRVVFSTIHNDIICTFKAMNERLPTTTSTAHFWAEPSRILLKAIEGAESLQRGLRNSKYNFNFDDYYQSVMNQCKGFLQKTGGSIIPLHMNKIDLYYTLPIFILSDSVVVKNSTSSNRFLLNMVGEGSYAHVFKYKDEFYQKNFILKRAKKDLNRKEVERFYREFEIMSQLNSPYVVEVYRYDKDKNEYVMENMDCSLSDYIEKYNSVLDMRERKNIGGQILKAFSYLQSKNIFHRDISPTNVLIKKYEHILVVKISDFGLVKIPDSNLTSMDTNFKGCFNDPVLMHEGFDNYELSHEIYALTHLLLYVITGKRNIDKIQENKFKNFASIGMNPEKSKRFSTIDEIHTAFNGLF